MNEAAENQVQQVSGEVAIVGFGTAGMNCAIALRTSG